ncbi:NAD(P)-binding protein [Daedalea quercina L-15889]|uniref:NAD(P)-binding protein n=1 Tax=Daedalea quercina L-15889 TaxID=1314783 RepID=A0A165KWZ7_9APHY|nr:NAD(P)-binding protein [Daedalea quercina L-15889]
MRILVIGASGFVGFPVAQALVRGGHVVYGVTRLESKAKKLAAEEIVPIVAETIDPSPWLPLVSTLDAVIEAIGGWDVEMLSPQVLTAVSDAATKYRPLHAPKLTYIYTSGAHTHSMSKDIVTDTTPITQSGIETSRWRPEFEHKVATHTILNGIVIRPAIMYGRSGSFLALMFQAARKGECIKWYGAPGARYSLLHQDDLGEMYRLAVEKSAILGGICFDAANDFSESVDDILHRLVEVSGASGYEYVGPQTPLERGLASSLRLRPYLARSLLGWQPRKAGLSDHMEIYYNAWKASL